MILRDLTAGDVPGAARLWHDGWHEAHGSFCPPALVALRTVESFAARLRADLDAARVAVAGETLLGFAMVKADELYQIFVAPQARGQGAAKALMIDAEARIAQAGYSTAWLACTVGNEAAARVYEKSGWTNTGAERMAFETSAGPFELQAWRFEKPL